jgi:coproporphyrinogen III oxidase-like Fe-S oxidoreductase
VFPEFQNLMGVLRFELVPQDKQHRLHRFSHIATGIKTLHRGGATPPSLVAERLDRV